MQTEIESKNLQCPLTNKNHVVSNCIGSKCMAWRWSNGQQHWPKFFIAENRGAMTESEAGIKPESCSGWKFCAADDSPSGWIEPKETADLRREGYCGLAGNPNSDKQADDLIEVLSGILDGR